MLLLITIIRLLSKLLGQYVIDTQGHANSQHVESRFALMYTDSVVQLGWDFKITERIVYVYNVVQCLPISFIICHIYSMYYKFSSALLRFHQKYFFIVDTVYFVCAIFKHLQRFCLTGEHFLMWYHKNISPRDGQICVLQYFTYNAHALPIKFLDLLSHFYDTYYTWYDN